MQTHSHRYALIHTFWQRKVIKRSIANPNNNHTPALFAASVRVVEMSLVGSSMPFLPTSSTQMAPVTSNPTTAKDRCLFHNRNSANITMKYRHSQDPTQTSAFKMNFRIKQLLCHLEFYHWTVNLCGAMYFLFALCKLYIVTDHFNVAEFIKLSSVSESMPVFTARGCRIWLSDLIVCSPFFLMTDEHCLAFWYFIIPFKWLHFFTSTQWIVVHRYHLPKEPLPNCQKIRKKRFQEKEH